MSLKDLSDFTIYSRYAHYIPELKRRETWDEIVERVFGMHGRKYKTQLENNSEFKKEFEFAKEMVRKKKVLGSQRALQFGGKWIEKENLKIYNCFSVDTEFITNFGVKSFLDFNNGDKIKTLTHNGLWKDATVKSYGQQVLNLVTIAYGNSSKDFYVTGNHRWIKRDGTETTELKVGDYLMSSLNIFNNFNYDSANPFEKLYWCYGYVYGDGTRIKNKYGEYTSSMVRLCKNQIKYHERFKEMGFSSSEPLSCGGDIMCYTGSYLKTAPNPEIDPPEMIRAFVAGYLAADGENDSNFNNSTAKYHSENQFRSILASDEDHINFIKKCFPIAGIFIISEKDISGQKTNFGIRKLAKLFKIRNVFDRKSSYLQPFRVISIKNNVKTENVWCLEVDEDKSFTFPNGLVTGNCSFTHLDRVSAFSEIFYALLCGVGVGYSVQSHHIEKLPGIRRPTGEEKIHVIEDSIEGWSDALAALLSSYFVSDQKFPYFGKFVKFDYSKIRPEGALIAGQFKAPGSKGLQSGLEKIRSLLNNIINQGGNRLSPINCYDIICHTSDCVLSGGIRRAASLCLFSKDDKEMMKSKTGDWYIKNPQRARSNNSVILERDKVTKEEFDKIYQNIKEYGEPAFYFTSDKEVGPNPCVAPETKILTRDGEQIIKDLDGKEVEIWNGVRWSKSLVAKTGSNQKLLKVTINVKIKNTSFDRILFATEYHKWYSVIDEEIQTKSLCRGTQLVQWIDPNSNDLVSSYVVSVEDTGRYDDTYCVNEPINHRAVFNGILTGQCVEISMYPVTTDGRSGIQGCNLSEINGKYCTSVQSFLDSCRAASIIGTLQAGYTNFNYLSTESKGIFEKEALLGVSLTGWMENPEVLFNEDILKQGAEIVKATNKKIAAMIGINPAARTCCVKPAGSTSCILETSSGIHPHHAKRYIRNVQSNKNEFSIQHYKEINPIAIEESVWSANKTDYVVSFACEVPKGSIVKNNINAIDFLNKIKFVQQNWVRTGNDKSLSIRNCDHNVSCTVVVHDNEWDKVRDFIFDNKEFFTGISLISSSGDLDYRQAPFTTVLTDKEIVEKYGNGSLLASGLIVDGINAFNGDLYSACEAVLGITNLQDLKEVGQEPKKPSRRDYKSEKEYSSALVDYSIQLNIFFQNKGDFEDLSAKYDWVRRAQQFANRYFNKDIKLMTYCLKHVDIWKKYLDINREHKAIDWSKVIESTQELVAADSLGAQSCSGGACSLSI